nr:MAG TPA: hypothetical protein [Caudoviricetes sp.]
MLALLKMPVRVRILTKRNQVSAHFIKVCERTS